MIVKRSYSYCRDFLVSFRVFSHKIASSECERERLEGEINISFTMSASNMYRTGDYVYVDAGPVRCLFIFLDLLNTINFLQSFWCPAH